VRPLIVWHIFRKDLVETLRDRRALFTTLVLPLVLYPLLFTAIGSFTSNKREQIKSQPARIAVWGPVPETAVEAVLKENATLVDRRASVPPSPEDMARQLVTDKTVDVVLLTPEGPVGPSISVKVYADSTQFESDAMQDRVLKVLRKHEALLLEERMVALGQPAISARPLLVEEEDLSSSARRAASLVGSILPYMVLVLLASAAFYSAIDLTAGEKERGTLQTLLTAPVHALEVVAGKYLAVVTMTLVAALANIVSLGLAIGRILSGDGGTAQGGFHMGPRVGLTLFLTLVPAALLLSALYVAVGVMARTYKEGQSYLMPLLFLVVFAALGSTLPGVELTPVLALVPLTNVALLMRELLNGRATLFLGTEVLISSFAYAAMGVVLAARVFETEQVLLSGEKPWKDIFARKAKGGLTPINTLFFVALLVVVVFYGTVPLMLAVTKEQVGRAIAGSELGFFLLPAVLWALLMRVPLREAFQLRLPSRRGLLGTALFVSGGWAVGLAIGSLLSYFQGAQDYSEQLGELLGKHGPLSMGMALLLVGLLPAVCEEACFRGVVLTGLARSGSRGLAVVGSALAFGVFHVNPYHVAAAATLGLVLGYAAYESQSLLPGVLMHFVNNGLQMVLLRVPEARAFFESRAVVGVGLLVTVLALWLLRGSGSRPGPAPGAAPLRPAGAVPT
jgi:sodium transport system permease protein